MASSVAKRALEPGQRVTLAYWAIRGLAQPIRLLLEYVQVPYEDKLFEQGKAPDFDKSCWFDVKDTILGDYPMPNLPYLIDGDLVITQSNAIVRHIARQHELLGSTSTEMARCDIMLEEGMDLRNRTVGLAYGRAGAIEEALPAYAEGLRSHFDRYSRFLGDGPWFAGQSLTACDFIMFELLDQNSLMVKGCLDQFPSLKAFCERFTALPAIKSYLASSRCIVFPCNNQHSQTTQKKIC